MFIKHRIDTFGFFQLVAFSFYYRSGDISPASVKSNNLVRDLHYFSEFCNNIPELVVIARTGEDSDRFPLVNQYCLIGKYVYITLFHLFWQAFQGSSDTFELQQ